jgi:hypothetical protein
MKKSTCAEDGFWTAPPLHGHGKSGLFNFFRAMTYNKNMTTQFEGYDWFSNLLRPEERVLWQGRPKQGGLIKPFAFTLLALVFLVFIALIAWLGLQEKGTTMGTNHLILAGIFFVADLIFFYIAVILLPGKARTMQYLITDQRILIKSKVFSEKVESYDLARIVDWEKHRTGDGNGELYFASFSIEDPDDADRVEREMEQGKEPFEDVLFGLENVDEVAVIFQDALDGQKKLKTPFNR